LLDISLPGSQENAKSIEELATLALEGIMEAHDAKGAIPGLKTGLIDLDRKLGGLRPKQFIVIAGETGEGKTALALKIAETLAVKDQTPVGILSLEMSGVELCDRWIASLARVDLHRFLVYGGNDKDYPKIVDATDALKKSKIIVRDESDLSALQMRAEARQLKVQYGIELLIVDYIQLMQVTGDSDNHEKQIAGIAQAMKNCAKELGIVVIGLSQVNDDGRVRESRAIGHHADKMIFIRHQGENSYLDVKKNRGGPVGSVPVVFIRPFAQFESKAKNSLTNE
jgi:replicative DNA helicase